MSIITYPNPILDKISSSAIKNLSVKEIKDLSEKMREECWRVDGFGISAIQVAEPFRIFAIVDPNRKDYLWMMDPKIRSMSGSSLMREGCLSIPGFFWSVRRFKKISISYYDLNFVKHYRTFTGLSARAIQHEIDHLDGILIPDFLKNEDLEDFMKYYRLTKSVYDYSPPEIDTTR